MNFGTRSLTILKNFSNINPSLLFKEGSRISTISPSQTVIAFATLSETVESDFGVYELSKFISTLSLFQNPNIEIGDKSAVISEGKRKVNYYFADPSMLILPPNKKLALPSKDVSFTLTNDNLASILKALSILSLPEIAIVGDGTTVFAMAIDSEGASADTYSIEVGETDKKFKAVFKSTNILLLPDDYEVEISSKGLARFASKDIEYFIAVEAKPSKFE